MKYALKHAVTVGTKDDFAAGAELEIRRPKGKDFRNLPAEGVLMSHMLDFVGRLAGLTTPQVDALDADDVLGLCEAVKDFFPNAMVGKTS